MKAWNAEGASRPVAQARIDTPLGPLTALATARGLAGLWFDGQKHHPGSLAAPVDERHPFIVQARRELTDFFASAKRRRAGFAVPLDPQGTAFQRAVWQQLSEIRCGRVTSYGELARTLGLPNAARAVGAAVGRNPLSVIVPCHRVLGSDGGLAGYAGGLARKEALLALEGARAQPSATSAAPARRAQAAVA
ncbi:MAG: methylated-DNA--[protein]-cysteine S-methyltransferase [Rubrivivax sp.]|nr:methylated-DNA--[protein]-cysteine S-methyltransferase [Rubrivivax sp.]